MEDEKTVILRAMKMADAAGDVEAVEEFAKKLDEMGPGLVERSKETLVQGASDAMSAIAGDSFTRGGDRVDKSPSERTSEALGGRLLPAVGQVAFDAAVTGARKVAPGAVDTASQVFSDAMSTKPVQAVVGAVGGAAKKYPEVADAVMEGVNIGAAIRPTMKPPKVRWVGNADAAVNRMKDKTRLESVARMLEPDDMDGPGKIVTKGPLKTKAYEPTDFEQRMYKEVAQVKGVRPKGNYTDNFNAINDEVSKLAKELDDKLLEVPDIDANKILGPINESVEKIAKQPTLVGDAGQAANVIFDLYIQEVKKLVKPGTSRISLRDMLQARRSLDDLLYGTDKNIFDVNTSKAKNFALGEIRRSVHDLIEEAAPDSNIKTSLRKQSDLLSARDTLRPRSIAEKGNAITRAIDALERDTGVKHPTTPLALAATGSNPIVASATAALAAGIGITKALDKASRIAYVRLVGELEKLINKGGPKAAQLQADKAIILSILNSNREEEKK